MTFQRDADLPPAHRLALYWAPPPDSALARIGAAWLGRDATGLTVGDRPAIAGFDPTRLDRLTEAPRHYALHGTLKPPFMLADGTDERELIAAIQVLTQELTRFTIPAFDLRLLDGFLALTPSIPCPALNDLAGQCVKAFDRFRRPAPAAELAKRRAAGLTPRQDENLLRWGYPYVFEEFRFHLTLSERLDAAEAARLQPALTQLFAPAIGQPLDVSDITLFAQDGADHPFHERARFPLTAGT
ncbi:MAG TPA: DUF1045 domain-containing protein [Terriglobales bacterium]|nr:DUF1045 domain-containing protein [Terriglobales bacterium]